MVFPQLTVKRVGEGPGGGGGLGRKRCYHKNRDRGATLKVRGGGGLTSDSKWGGGGAEHFFLSNSNFQKSVCVCVWGGGGGEGCPLYLRGPSRRAVVTLIRNLPSQRSIDMITQMGTGGSMQHDFRLIGTGCREKCLQILLQDVYKLI